MRRPGRFTPATGRVFEAAVAIARLAPFEDALVEWGRAIAQEAHRLDGERGGALELAPEAR